MKNYIPKFLEKMIKDLGVRDVTSEFSSFLISQAETDIHKQENKISRIQKKYGVPTLKEMIKTYIKGKDHSFETDEDFRGWDAAETIVKNRINEVDKLRRFLNDYSKKHPLSVRI